MGLLCNAILDKLLDSRLRDKFLAEGKVTKEQIDDYLSSLPDDINNVKLCDKEKDEKNVNEEK